MRLEIISTGNKGFLRQRINSQIAFATPLASFVVVMKSAQARIGGTAFAMAIPKPAVLSKLSSL